MPAGQIDAALLEQIKERTPLVSLISRKVPLKRSGGTHVGCCPFHSEKTPSFHVYPDRFKCFGCGEHGDAISFVQKINRSSFPEAVRELAQQAGIEIPGSTKPLSAAERERREQANAAAGEREAGRQRRREAERQADHEAIRRMAKTVWDRADAADPNHSYLARKGLAGDVEGLKQDKWGNLLVPRRDIHGHLWNIERILPEKTASGKDKFTLSRKVDGKPRGGRVDGVFTVFGDLDAPGPLGITTGTATAKSVRRGTGWTTVAVGSDSNLLVVAQAMRERFPEREIIIAGDNDIRLEGRHGARGIPLENQGRIKAEAAAKAVGGAAAIPPFPAGSNESDWNDCERIHGTASAGELLAAARRSLNPEIKEDLMPDASGLPETTPSAYDRTNPDTGPGHWALAIDRLREAGDDPELLKNAPTLTKRAAKLLADIDQGADLQDPQIQTRIAYLVSDIDRVTGSSLVLPPELRSVVDDLAVSYPGLDHAEIKEMLRQTASMQASDYQTIHDVRVLAQDYVNHDAAADPDGTNQVTAERIRVIQSRIQDALAGPEAPPHVEIPEHNAVPAIEAQVGGQDPRPAGTQARRQTGQAGMQQNVRQPGETPQKPQQNVPEQADKPGRRGQEPQQTQQAGTINIPVPSASRILNRLAQDQVGGPPPWQGLAQALSDRLGSYQQAQADRYHRELERGVETAGRAALKALAALDTGPAADVMRKIGQEAAKDPNGASGVIEQMRPGGKHETLRNELNAVFARDKDFSASFDRAKVTLGGYLQSREALEQNYHRRGWRIADLDEKLEDTDRAIVSTAERTPGRESGKSLSEELAKTAMEMAEALFEKVRQALSKIQSGVSHEAAAAASPSPSMSATP